MLYVMPFLVAMVVTTAWLPLFGRLAVKWQIVDRPNARKVHATAIPRIGGIAMAIGVMVAAIIILPLRIQDRYFLLGAFIIVLFGALDDRFDLDYRIKFLGQLLAAAIVVIGGDVQIHTITLVDRVTFPQLVSIPLTMVFLIGITNAINLADGLDGLAGGTTLLCLCAVAMLAYAGGQTVCAGLSLAFAGAVLGFLRFNTYPATVFMGDAGSQLLGFAVGVLSMDATQSGDTAVSAAVPILLLALPILDTTSVMLQRVSEGRSPFSADRNHIHHKLLRLGFDHHEAVTVIYLIQADLFVMAYWLRFESDLEIVAVVVAFFAATILTLQLAERRGWRFRPARATPGAGSLSGVIAILHKPRNVPLWSFYVVALSIASYGSMIVAKTDVLGDDVRMLVLALLAVTVALLAFRRVRPLGAVEQVALYTTIATLVYLDSIVPSVNSWYVALNWASVLAVAAGISLKLIFSKDRRFVLTPLDLIVLFVGLVLPSFRESLGFPEGDAGGIAKLIILFYGAEVLMSRANLQVVWLRVGAASLLGGLALRPFM